MNLKNLLTTLLMLFALTVLVSSSSFAQTYVSNTNGNDVVGTGSEASPYKTITVGITNTAEGGTVIIDADTYNEANISITKSITLKSRVFNALTVATITNGITINGADKVVNLGRSEDVSVGFNLGSTPNALVLTAGTLNITSANVTIAGGGSISRSGGSINQTPTTTNVSVNYSGANAITAGPELPASLGTGSLNINMGAAATLVSVAGNVALSSGQIVVVQGSATFSGNVSITSDANIVNSIDNQGAGTVTFANAITGARATEGAAVGTVLKNGAGTLSLTGGVSGTSTFTFGLLNGAGTINVGSGTYAGSVNNNTAAGVLNLTGSAVFSNATVSNNHATAVIKLNGFQLTLSGTTTLTNLGNIISATATTVGSGMLNITGTVTTTNAGELPNVTISSGGKLTLGAATSVYGTFTLASAVAGALTDGGFNVSILGASFTRSNNTPGNYVATGTLTFASATPQSFSPGASLVLNNLTVNKGASSIVTLAASVEVTNNLVITAGKLDVGNFNINLTGNNASFNNSGSAYSGSGVGYVIFSGSTPTLQGSGVFGNILVDVGNANTLTTASSIDFSGTLFINRGSFVVANTHTAEFVGDPVANPTIKINTTAGNGAAFTKIAGGTVTYTASVNLEYNGAGAYTVAAEWTEQPLKINNLTINTTNTVTGVNANATIAGTLTVAKDATLAQGANTYSLSGAGLTHSVLGTVTGGTLTITGSGALNGVAAADGGAATVNHLAFEPTANGSAFTSSNLKVIGGNLTLQGSSTATGATANVTLNGTTGTISGNVTVGNGTLGPNATVVVNGTTTSVLTGNVVLTDGNLTLTRGGNSTTIGGGVTLTKGTLTLGSNVTVTGVTSQAAGNIALGGFSYTQLGNYTRTDVGTVTNGTVIFTSTGAPIAVTVGTDLVLPNVTFNGTANGVAFNAALTIAGDVTIDNAGTVTQSAGVLTLTGGAVTVTDDAGSFTGAVTFGGATAATLTLGKAYSIATVVVNKAGSSLTLAGAPADVARTLTVGTAFTLTAGTVNLGIHTLDVSTAFTHTAGTITQGAGYLNLNVAAPAIAATGFSIDNLKLTGNANFGTSAFTVVKNLVLAGSLTTSADGKLTLGDGVVVERQGNAFTLSHVPAFGATTNLAYSTYTGGNITTAKEKPVQVNNLTVATDAGASKTILAANVTVNGTLSLADMLDATTTTDVAITMASGSTLELKVNGTSALDENLTKAGTMNLVYNGASATTTRELGAVTDGAYDPYAGNVTFVSNVALDQNLTLNGLVTFDGGDFDVNAKALNLGGSVATTEDGGNIINGGVAANVTFVGASNTTLGLNSSWAIPATINLRVNKTSAANTVTYSGGNLDFATNVATLYLMSGSLVAANQNVAVLLATDPDDNEQGFSRTGESQVVGKVIKAIEESGRYEFPVGTTSDYRPAVFLFPSAPSFDFNLTVQQVNENPAGTNGLPIEGTDINDYPDFYWLISADANIPTSVVFDLELTGEGFTDFDNVADLRVIRRVDGDTVANKWFLQGTTYDNYLVGQVPHVNNLNSRGGLNAAGARFTYGLTSDEPVGNNTVAGKVLYDNNANSPISGAVVTVSGGNVVATDTTDATGAYSVSVPNGSYTVSATTNKAWGGVNSTDALAVQLHTVGSQVLAGLPLQAADVNNSATVSSADALEILRRDATLINSFAKGNWIVESKSITVNGNLADQNLKAIAVGDVNRSYAPVAKTAATVSLSSDSKLQVNPSEAIEIPVRISADANVGAFSLSFTYPADLAEFEAVSSKADGIVVGKSAGKVVLSWASVKALDLKANDAVVTLKFKSTSDFKGGKSLSLELDNLASEIADANAKVINVALKSASVEGYVPASFALKQNYPNPFNPATTIKYELPVAGTVQLTIYNTIGEVVSTLVNEVQEAGVYDVRFNASNLASGIYLYRLDVTGVKSFSRTQKMILMK